MHLLFDLDGTLIDSAPDLQHCMNILLAETGHQQLTLEQITHFVGAGSKKLVERAFAHFHAQPETDQELEELTARFITLYMQNLTRNTTIYPDVVATLESLKNRGHVLSICTNKPHQPTLATLQALELSDFFTIITGGDSYAERKPHPMPILKTMAEVDIPVAECIMLGDSIDDIQAGKAAKIRTAFVTYGYTRGDIKQIDADFIINEFKEISKLL